MPKRSTAVSSVLARLAVSISAEATVSRAAIGRRGLVLRRPQGWQRSRRPAIYRKARAGRLAPNRSLPRASAFCTAAPARVATAQSWLPSADDLCGCGGAKRSAVALVSEYATVHTELRLGTLTEAE
jgi:hypothetical protein